MNLLHHIIEQQCAANPQAAAIFWQQQTISYRDLHNMVQQAVQAITASTAEGDRIAILALNRPEYIALMYAVPAAGRILVPLNTRLATPALEQQIIDLDVRLLIGDGSLLSKMTLRDHVEAVAFGSDYDDWLKQTCTQHQNSELQINPRATAWLLFTSGTTGLPKAACLTHRSLFAALESANHGRPVHKGDRYLYPFPLFHISAHNILHQHLHGAAIALLPSFKAEDVLAVCKTKSINTMSLAPTMIAMLLDHPDFDRSALQSVRTIGYGASAISTGLLNRVLQETDCGLSQGFGMTELSGSIAFLDAEAHRLAARDRPELLQTVGKVVPKVELKIVDEKGNAVAANHAGEIVVRATQVIEQYWENPTASADAIRDGWLSTGDIGRLDSDGYLSIVDRKKDIIITGGENVASREVENVLTTYPGVRQAAVVGVPDARWGERVCALIESENDNEDDDNVAKALIDFCRQQLAGYKAPKQIQFGALPINASGKVDKGLIRKLFV